jgi:hypothetical protein
MTNDSINEDKTALPPIAEIYPTCRFCGKAEMPFPDYSSQEEANEAATRRCDCQEAEEYQAELEQKERREDNIKKLKAAINNFEQYCVLRYVNLTPERAEALHYLGTLIIEEVISVAAVRFERMKVTMKLTTKGNLAINFTYTDSANTEVS